MSRTTLLRGAFFFLIFIRYFIAPTVFASICRTTLRRFSSLRRKSLLIEIVLILCILYIKHPFPVTYNYSCAQSYVLLWYRYYLKYAFITFSQKACVSDMNQYTCNYKIERTRGTFKYPVKRKSRPARPVVTWKLIL